MDVWDWVYQAQSDLRESGHTRLADVVEALPEAALNHRYHEAEALAYEGLGLARDLGVPWIEVFLRHWHLQARVANRGEGATALSHAVAALEAAHRDETRDCPQSVCTVQDLAICYSKTDGPGWAPERLAVAEEALARISPAWSCFSCITAEKATALVDLGRADEALATLDETGDTARQLSEFVTIIARLEVLLALGRWDACVRAAKRFRASDEGIEERQLQVHIRHAYALCRTGGHAEAASLLPSADAVAPADMKWWARTVELAVAGRSVPNDWRLGTALREMVATLEELGSWRDAFEVALVHAGIALDRGRTRTAIEAIDIAARLAQELRDPATVEHELAALRMRLPDVPGLVSLPASPQELLSQLDGHEDPDPEADGDLLVAAHHEWPHDRAVATRLALALAASGDDRAAIAVLDPLVVDGRHEDEATHALLELRLAENDELAITALADRLRPQSPALAGWVVARHAFACGDWRRAIAHCQDIISAEPDAANTRRLLAASAHHLGEFGVELEALLEIVDLGVAEEADFWSIIVAASATERWDAVRHASDRLGIDLATKSGPIDEEWHPIVVRYDGGEALALRTGPATARILSVSPPNRRQRHGDLVVFEPTAVEPFDPDDEEYPIFEHVADIALGGFVAYRVEGAAPEETELDTLRSTLRDADMALWVYSAGEYDVRLPSGALVPSFYAAIAVRAGEEQRSHAVLTGAARSIRERIVWPELAEAAGQHEVSAEHLGFLEAIDDNPADE